MTSDESDEGSEEGSDPEDGDEDDNDDEDSVQEQKMVDFVVKTLSKINVQISGCSKFMYRCG